MVLGRLTHPCLMSRRKLLQELLHTSCLEYTLTQPSPCSNTLSISSKRQLQGYISPKKLKRAGLPDSHLLHFYITVIRPVLEYCAPVWHYALTKEQSESQEAVQKRAVHITHNLTRGMSYSSMTFHASLDSLAARREDLSRRLFQ